MRFFQENMYIANKFMHYCFQVQWYLLHKNPRGAWEGGTTEFAMKWEDLGCTLMIKYVKLML